MYAGRILLPTNCVRGTTPQLHVQSAQSFRLRLQTRLCFSQPRPEPAGLCLNFELRVSLASYRLERLSFFLRDHGQKGKRTHVVFERRGKVEDDEL